MMLRKPAIVFSTLVLTLSYAAAAHAQKDVAVAAAPTRATLEIDVSSSPSSIG